MRATTSSRPRGSSASVEDCFTFGVIDSTRPILAGPGTQVSEYPTYQEPLIDFLLDSLGERDYIFLGYLGDSASMDVMAEIRQSRPEEL